MPDVSVTRIWVEELTLPVLLSLLARNMLRRGVRVMHDPRATTRAARVAARLFGGRLFEEAELSFGRKNESGEAVSYDFQKALMDCAKLFLKKNGSSPVEQSLRRTLLQAYFAEGASSGLRHVTMAAARIRETGAAGRDVIRLGGSHLNPVIRDRLRGRGFDIEWGWPVKALLTEAAAFGHAMAMCAGAWLLSVFEAKGPRHGGLEDGKGAVWFEYLNGCMEMRGARSLYFWGEFFDRREADVVFHIDRPDTPVPEASAKLEACGEKWIDMRRLWKAARLDFRDVLEAGGKVFARSGAGFWARLFEARAFAVQKLYESVFRRFRVKALIHHQEGGWKSVPQYAGLRAAGGVSLGFHWSNYPFYNEANVPMAHDVMFVWGKTIYELMHMREGRICGRFLPCGLWMLPKENGGMDARRGLSEKVSFVMAVFDSSCDRRIFQTPEMLSEFYGAVFGMLEENPSWGALVKCKWSDGRGRFGKIPGGARLEELAARLESEGRLVFPPMEMDPGTAALAADLSVCFGLNTAGIIAGTLGARAVHWDCAGFKRHFLYKEPGQKVLFDDLGRLREAVGLAARGDRSVGDFGKHARGFNHFSDRRAAERVGKFINSYILRTKRCATAEEALEEEIGVYIGKNSVGGDFYHLGKIFEKET